MKENKETTGSTPPFQFDSKSALSAMAVQDEKDDSNGPSCHTFDQASGNNQNKYTKIHFTPCDLKKDDTVTHINNENDGSLNDNMRKYNIIFKPIDNNEDKDAIDFLSKQNGLPFNRDKKRIHRVIVTDRHNNPVGTKGIKLHKNGANSQQEMEVIMTVINRIHDRELKETGYLDPNKVHHIILKETNVKDFPSNLHTSDFPERTMLSHQNVAKLPYNDFTFEQRLECVKAAPKNIPLPPINIYSLREIELQQIVQNPRLRHDLVFDPFLQFRPNLDNGIEKRKREISEIYWGNVQNEIYVYQKKPEAYDRTKSRLMPLFDNMRGILQLMLPPNEGAMVSTFIDTDLFIQKLIRGALEMVSISEYISAILSKHCSESLKPKLDEMCCAFKEAANLKSLEKCIVALAKIFMVLEAVKLDIANRQVRILRPSLVLHCADYERQYYANILRKENTKFDSSFRWIKNNFKLVENHGVTPAQHCFRVCIKSILSLLSCCNMATFYPETLSADKERLIETRSDVRQIVCLLISRLLFEKLVRDTSDAPKTVTPRMRKTIDQQVMALVTDSSKNRRWTKNASAIALYLCDAANKIGNESLHPTANDKSPKTDISAVKIAEYWLSKQLSPESNVYKLLERRVLLALESSIFQISNCSTGGIIDHRLFTSYGDEKLRNQKNRYAMAPTIYKVVDSDPESSISPISVGKYQETLSLLCTITALHWSVFGPYYLDFCT